ncbi:ATP-grasp domain-containing protein [Streptomyces decoyicus]|uniref:ATP-grasp domain-containing protein n=1 Tax=Streptomyces decoyicus TaxID=249567 RepID=UPI00386E4BB5
MSGERVLLLGGKADFIRKAVECGLEVVNIQKPSGFAPALLEHCRQLHVLDYQDVPLVTALAEAMHRVRPFTRVLTQTEAALVVAGHLTSHLGLAGNGVEAVRILHDKRALRTLLNHKGIGEVAFLQGATREDAQDFVRRHGAAVLKPAMGSGSLGVRKVRSPAEADKAWQWADRSGLTDFMVEELLTGQEFSVETFSIGGEHTVLCVTGKDTAGRFVEVGHVVPAPLPTETAEEIGRFVRKVLDAVGLIEGLAHTEVMLTPDGPRVVESHSRRGGGRINELVQLVHGIDMDTLALKVALPGQGVPTVPAATGAAATRFVMAEPGRVTSVDGVAAAAALPGVREVKVGVAPGDVVRPTQWSEDRCGHVVVYAEDSAAAERLARQAVDAIVIRTVPDDEAIAAPLHHRLAEVDEVLDPFASREGQQVNT